MMTLNEISRLPGPKGASDLDDYGIAKAMP
jgi:hypothetical protein